MNDEPVRCKHLRRFCLECHGVIEFEPRSARTFACPVFGCTIPRGIPHEHPAGVSAVMRDPVAPLTADERAELMSYRMKDEVRRMRVLDAAAGRVHVIDGPIHAGRKLRDALLMTGVSAPRHEFSLEYVEPRRTLAQSVGKLMAWMFGIPALALAAFAIGMHFGWWV